MTVDPKLQEIMALHKEIEKLNTDNSLLKKQNKILMKALVKCEKKMKSE